MRRGSVLLIVSTVLSANQANAHAFGARYDLPLPLSLYLAAAGAAVALSFVGVLVFLRSARTRALHLDIPLPVWLRRGLVWGLSVLGVSILAILIGAAFAGPPEATRNVATIGIWVIWWVGFLLFSSLIVSVWPWVDPFRTLSRGVSHLAGRNFHKGPPCPAVLGWLAPAGLLALAWIELVSDWSEDPAAVGVIVLSYLAVSLIGGLLWGASWFSTADPLGRVFAVLGRVAIIGQGRRGTVRLRPVGEGLLNAGTPLSGEVALITTLIGIVLFDGLSETPAWAGVLDFISESQTLRPGLLWLRDQGADLLKVIRTIGLFATVLTFYASYWLLIAAMRAAVGGDRTTRELAGAFAGTLLPIAVAYHLSHYLSYLMIAGQLILPAASDPFALGWDLFGTRTRTIDISVINAEQVWWVAFTSLIAGHALAVLVGHRRALSVFGDARTAALSQIPMTLAMIGLTILSLWILSQPITQ